MPTLLGVPLPQRLPDDTAAVAPHLTGMAQSLCSDHFLNQLKWELFLLSVGCQGPQLADKFGLSGLPSVPATHKCKWTAPERTARSRCTSTTKRVSTYRGSLVLWRQFAGDCRRGLGGDGVCMCGGSL